MFKCKKLAFKSKREIKKHIKNTSLNKVLLYYECKDCGWWHTTSKKSTAKYKQQQKDCAEIINLYKQKRETE